jgi:MFS transporter, DHA3 family, macrolide efflux protein
MKKSATGFRAYVILWSGQFVSLIGSSLASFALGVRIYQMTGSAAELGLIFALALIPTVLVSPVTGALVDRWGPRRALLVSNWGGMLVALALTLLLATHSFATWNICLATIISSVMRGLQVPAFGSTVPLLVPERHIGRANGLLQLATALSQVMAPIAAGFLLLAIRLEGVILINCVSFVAAIVTVLLTRIPALRPEDDEAGQAAPVSLLGSFAQSWNYVTARRGLVSLMGLFGALCFFCGFVDVLYYPTVLAFASTGALGTVLTVGGVGMVVGSLALSAWGGPRRRTAGMLAFSVLLGVSVIVGALRPNVSLIAVAAFVFLGSTALIEGNYQAIWQTKIEPRLLGRVLAMQNMVTMAPQMIAYLVAGLLADGIFQPLVGRRTVHSHFFATLVGTGPGRGFALTMLIVGVLILATAAWGYLNPGIGHLDDRLPDAVAAAREPTAGRV